MVGWRKLCGTDKLEDSPNTLNKGFPKQASMKEGRGFFTSPGRSAGAPVRRLSPTFDDHWSQPRLFYNSLSKVEQQFLINAIRFETSHLSTDIQTNVLKQLNKVSHDVAVRVGSALGLEAPEADDTYYHNNKTAGLSIFSEKLPTIATLTVGVLASTKSDDSLNQAKNIKDQFAAENVTVTIVGETLMDGVDQTYSQAEAIGFDGIIVADGAEGLFKPGSKSPLYPSGRPAQIVTDGYTWGKPVGFVGAAGSVTNTTYVSDGPGVFTADGADEIVEQFKDGLATFRFTDRFALDEEE